jgi:hypothetical protein
LCCFRIALADLEIEPRDERPLHDHRRIHRRRELRCPVPRADSILGHAELLQRSPGLAPKGRSSGDVVRRSGEHLLMLIDDLLDLARIEVGSLDLAPSSSGFSVVETSSYSL